MLTKTVHKDLEDQSLLDKMYLLKLIAQQMLGPKWIYFRKIKQSGDSFSFLKETTIMEQMKATRSALNFTSKNASKLYKVAYKATVSEIKKYTGDTEGLPELDESGEEETPLKKIGPEFDAIIISWTPIKFLLPAKSIRSKGAATQRHTEGLIAKLFFKTIGFYSDPQNWNKAKLVLYLNKIDKNSSFQDVASALEPLKKDLSQLIDAYQPFKFGKASLSKDVTQDVDAFDDAMGVESFESQVTTLYWYQFIYEGMENFLMKYFCTLVTATTNRYVLNYLTTIFKPALEHAIEIKNIFFGSFETDRTKKSFRKPLIALRAKKRDEGLTKKLKTKQGIYATHTYNQNMLDFKSMSSGFKDVPQEDSDWWMFAKQYILGIDRPSQSLWDVVKLREHIDPSLTEGSADKLETKLKELLGIKNELKIRIQKIVEEKKKITVFQEKIDEDASINKAKRVEFEEYKGKILKEELRLDKEKQKLKKQFEKIQKKKEKKNQKSQFDDMSPEEKLNLLEKIEAEEAELNRLDIRENALMQIMTIMINCTIYQRQANSKLMDRFKERIKSDKELEVKRIEEINKQVDKKLRAMNKKLSKIRRMKQEETAIVLAKDIEKFKKSIAEKCQGIEDDSKRELAKQEKRLKKLFATASDPNLGEAKSAKVFLELIRNIDRQKNFVPDFIKYTSIKIKNEFSDTLIPFYQNMFEILNPDIQEKVMLVQAIEKSGSDKGVKIALTDEEIAEYDGIIEDSKNKLNKVLPKIFENKVICMTESMTLEQLLNLSMDKVSMETIMRLKLIAPGSGKPIKLPVEIIKELFKLNELINPVPKYNLIKEGGHKEKDPQKAIDVLQLGKLLRA
ncbi:MAG: hypothetical protein HOD92_16785 [Deltaproteobacteria bacterium]|jgi:hypothetical protein|nr:hypothetical protein [Deltaproteobacteria bacterium]